MLTLLLKINLWLLYIIGTIQSHKKRKKNHNEKNWMWFYKEGTANDTLENWNNDNIKA